MPQALSLAAAAVALVDEHLGQPEPKPDMYAMLADELIELVAQPHMPTADVAYATGSLASALCSSGSRVTAPLLNDGRDHSDVLHWHDGLGRTWVIRVVGQVP
jgi:hypothetical protein